VKPDMDIYHKYASKLCGQKIACYAALLHMVTDRNSQVIFDKFDLYKICDLEKLKGILVTE
jgi:hypothetical protein